MKESCLLTFLVTLFSINFVTAQSFKKNFAIKEHVFEVSFAKGSDSIIHLKTKLVNGTDSALLLLNNIDKQVFKSSISDQIKKILPDAKSKFSIDNNDAIDKTLDIAFEEYLAQQKKEADAKDALVIKFGKEEYFGLTDADKAALVLKMQELKKLQAKHYYLKKEAPHNCNILGLGIWSNNRYEKYLTDSGYYSLVKSIRRKENEIRELNQNRKFEVSLIGNANVISSFKVAQQSQINGGFGIIVAKPNRVEFLGGFTISQTSDTLTAIGNPSEDFGTSVLIPGVRKFSLFTSYRLKKLWPNSYSNFYNKIGFAWNVNITPYNWVLKNTANTSDSIGAKLIPAAVDIMFPYSWVNIFEDGKDVSISTDIGVTARYIMGNITADQRKNFLGKSDIFYGGLIAGLNIKYNGLRFQFHVPILFGSRVEGLTGGQAYASMTFIANIVGSNPKSLFK